MLVNLRQAELQFVTTEGETTGYNIDVVAATSDPHMISGRLANCPGQNDPHASIEELVE